MDRFSCVRSVQETAQRAKRVSLQDCLEKVRCRVRLCPGVFLFSQDVLVSKEDAQLSLLRSITLVC